ncbi:MAG TPA: hypothetical protein VFF72_03895, partial [Caldimonas sp.]|nr:hypothetical protein [Caldimonas sp.]
MTLARAALAESLLAARDGGRLIALPSEGESAFGLADAYAVADEIRRLRIARGEKSVGYKIGFTNRSIWDR